MTFSDTVHELSAPKADVRETWRPHVAGEVRTIVGADGEQKQYLSLPDLDGQIIILPQYRSDIIVGGPVPQDLQDRGVSQFVAVEIDRKSKEYLLDALTRLPEVLATHATFNYDVRPNLAEFPVCFPSPILGIKGFPWGGKTLFLLASALIEDDSKNSFRDFDKFGIESFANCLPDLQKLSHKDPDYFNGSMHRTVTEILKVYEHKRANHKMLDTSGITLFFELSHLLDEYRGGNPRKQYILDLPGIDSQSAPPHIFQLLRFAIPTIDLLDAIKNDRSLVENLQPKARISIDKKYPYDKVESATAYFVLLRRKIFNPTNQDGDSLLNRALTLNYLRQTSAIRLIESNLVQ